MDAAARQIYEGSYYHTAFEVQKGLGVGWTTHAINEETIKKVLSRPWTSDNQTFRDRCWTNKQSLVNSVNTQLTQMIIRGEAPDRAIAAISKQFEVSKSKAGRLVMTESAYFASAAQKDCYKELDVEQYQIVAALDRDTCDICGSLDGKVFKMSEYQEGLTAPPFHPWCRCCTAPYFADMEGLGERFARDAVTGERYKVPRDMTYEQWKAKQDGAKQPDVSQKLPADVIGISDNKKPEDGPVTKVSTQKVTDVTDLYKQAATPGQGEIIFENGYKVGKHQAEVDFANWIHDTFGGDITLLSESTERNIKRPDFVWLGKNWELKSARSINSADKSLQHAIKQIQGNPGGVMLDLMGDLDLEKLERQILGRFLRSRIDTMDVMIVSKKTLLKVYRYKK